jgi:carbon starvation protein
MNSLTLVLLTSVGYLLAYRLYGRFIGHKIFELSSRNQMPSHQFQDGIDFVPSKKHIVLGHHFTTIAGLGPIVGPAIGIIWGWLPALIWIFFGSIFMGAVHDFSAMVISARNQGKTIGDLTGDLINPSTRYAFQVIIQFLLWIVIAIFSMIMGILFQMYPQVVFPVWIQIPIAIWLGREIRKGKNDLLYSIIAVLLLYLSVWIGLYLPITLPPVMGSPVVTWTLVLFVYVFIASTLPIDLLLQPRDYINSHQLLVATALLVVGVFIAHPVITAPAVNPAATALGSDIPPLFPLLFITIACGAISGFHSLASSGTSVKQIDREEDMLSIGYGGMLMEGVLAIIVLVAIAGGLGMGLEKDGILYTGAEAYKVHYASWATAQGLGAQIEAFVVGAANLMASFGLPQTLGKALMAVFIVAFAGTTLDSATRIQRLSLQELCKNREGLVARPMNNRYVATFVVLALAAMLTFLKPGAKGALILWPLFGALNQLLAALGLTIATVYLARKGKNILVTFVPMVFMLVMTVWAMASNLKEFLAAGDTVLTILSVVIFALTAWLLIGATFSILKKGKDVDRKPAEKTT